MECQLFLYKPSLSGDIELTAYSHSNAAYVFQAAPSLWLCPLAPPPPTHTHWTQDGPCGKIQQLGLNQQGNSTCSLGSPIGKPVGTQPGPLRAACRPSCPFPSRGLGPALCEVRRGLSPPPVLKPHQDWPASDANQCLQWNENPLGICGSGCA